MVDVPRPGALHVLPAALVGRHRHRPRDRRLRVGVADGTVRRRSARLRRRPRGHAEGDTIVSLNGQTGRAARREIAHGWVGQRYDVVVRRDGAERTLSFTLGPKDRRYWTDPEGLVLLSGVPVSALAIGLAWLVAWRRPDHATARLAALVLACVPVVGTMQVRRLAPGLAGFVARLPAPLAAPFLAGGRGRHEPSGWSAMTMFAATFPRRPVRVGWLWAPLFLFGAVLVGIGGTLTYNIVYWPDVPVLAPPVAPNGRLGAHAGAVRRLARPPGVELPRPRERRRPAPHPRAGGRPRGVARRDPAGAPPRGPGRPPARGSGG